jgi:hypothetical protein
MPLLLQAISKAKRAHRTNIIGGRTHQSVHSRSIHHYLQISKGFSHKTKDCDRQQSIVLITIYNSTSATVFQVITFQLRS